ncbi:MAG: tRNA (N(6)-L-threonylcarbamoyladenosine(37)-C(2))-methylthiotransferase MtaB [Eubacterium sp.]|nr:tRNA (N(6)-L-threonylcarbamoyladenosine(37)-C(2))-methylthiotransferase MtaB [Eubacterium sp.]
MKRVSFHNLGCKVNAYETAAMEQKLQDAGYEVVAFGEPADIVIVNTCSVTNMADKKSRQMLHRAKRKNPDALVIAAGCYVQTKADEVKADEAVDVIVGNNEKKNIVEIIESATKEAIIDINQTDEYEEMDMATITEHTRAHIKIQDGCNNFCSYCIIPYARGRVRSRDFVSTKKEAQELVNSGYKEIVITGIEVSTYDFDGKKLIDVVEELNKIEGLKRIRLSSLNPDIITDEFARRLSKCEKICPHFHLSMQSGCDKTLKDMNRHYTSADYLAKVEILRKYFDDPAITTDIIVGFPGESDKDFETTLDTVKKAKFYQIHVFKYSRRDGTVASSMDNQVDEQIKNERSERLISLADELQTKYEQQFLGTEQEVLFEEEIEIDGAKYMLGHTKNYLQVAINLDQNNAKSDENDKISQENSTKNVENLQNTIKKVNLTDLHKNHIILARNL